MAILLENAKNREFYAVSKFMVDHADILLAVCQKIPHSGTMATINYARKVQRESIIVDPFTRRLIHENPATDSVPN